MIWISHRGLHQRHVENSLHAFEAAAEAGFHTLETDLRSTLDGQIVLHHDPTLIRTAGHDAIIEQLDAEQCQRLRLRDGQPLLTFDTFARTFTGQQWILDIKPESAERTLNALRDWASHQQKGDWLCRQARFLLWDPAHTRLLRERFPAAITMAPQPECRRAGLSLLMGLTSLAAIRHGRTYSLPPVFHGLPLFRRSLVDAYHRLGGRVLAFLPEGPAQQQQALRSGVDEILSNSPPL
ncbi:MAG: glycerophosphodiester phosphodiesterase family protein [Pseudomonadota bacterium]|nr:glycerophosphodiester phosphodiesterase family protein [Pseudomonadota bacterium]